MKVQSHRHSICSILQYTGSDSTGSTGNNTRTGCIRSALSYISLYVQCMQIGTSIVQDSRTGTGITTTGLGALVEYGKDMKRVEVCIATCIDLMSSSISGSSGSGFTNPRLAQLPSSSLPPPSISKMHAAMGFVSSNTTYQTVSTPLPVVPVPVKPLCDFTDLIHHLEYTI